MAKLVLEYRAKYPEVSWNKCLVEWDVLEEGHLFSTELDYQFRVKSSFIPGYFRDETDGEVLFFNSPPSDLWVRVNVVDPLTGDLYTAPE